MGSEPGMGWNFASAISSFCETHVIVTENSRKILEAYQSEHAEETRNLHFHYVSVSEPLQRWGKIAKKAFPTLFFYYKYHKLLHLVAEKAQELDKEEDFDLVHQVTLAGFRTPGYLWRLGKPLLWGPIGGMDNAPFRLLVSLRFIDIIGYSLRNIVNCWQKRFGYAARIYSQKADYILASTAEGERVVKNCWNRQGEYMCEIGTAGMTEADFVPATHQPGEPLKLCWVGIMNNQRKNLPLLFRALDYCEAPTELCVMGEGAMKERWEKLARELPSRHKVTFLGRVPQMRVFEEMRRSHLFCITSVKDDTSSVLLEALQHGLPVIAPNSCGFAGVITDECGIRIDIDWPESFARAYGKTLNRLASDEEWRLNLAMGAVKRAEEFTWFHKTARLKEIYSALTRTRLPQ